LRRDCDGQASGKHEFAQVCSAAKSAEEKATCDDAEKYFTEFLWQEQEWRRLFLGR